MNLSVHSYINYSISRWRCQQHSRAPGSSSVPPGCTDQEDQGRPSGKYVSTSKGSLLRDAQKDNGQPPAKEKEVLTHLVVCKRNISHKFI